MRRLFCCCLLLVFACRRDAAKQHAAPFDRNAFIVNTLGSSLSDIDLGEMAAKRGRRPETRQFGAVMHRDHRQFLSALSALAARRNIKVPATVVDQKRVALKQNLTILPGEVFDRGYVLAMIQDLNATSANLRAASSCGDRDLEQFASAHLPVIAAEQQNANALLNSLGGSPFGFVPN